jgi:transposase
VQRAVEPYRQELLAEARATVRFETTPGRQLQIDFGERLVEIAGRKIKVFLFVATLGYSSAATGRTSSSSRRTTSKAKELSSRRRQKAWSAHSARSARTAENGQCRMSRCMRSTPNGFTRRLCV